MLVETGADVNAQNDIGRTPLHHAASNNRLDVATVSSLCLEHHQLVAPVPY